MKKSSQGTYHPFIYFWLGILTGAIVVGLLFFYKSITPQDYESSLFRYEDFGFYNDFVRSYEGTAIGDPSGFKTGGEVNIGDPTGF